MNTELGIKWYLDAVYGEMRPATWVKYRMTLGIFLRTFKGRELDEITRQELREWRDGLVIRDKDGKVVGPLKESSKNKYMDRIKALYTYLNHDELSSRNPAAGLAPLDVPAVRRVRLPPQSLPAMLGSARHPRDRAIVATSIELLLRGGEVAELRVSDVFDGSLRVLVEKAKGELVEDDMAISENLQRELDTWLHYYRQNCGIVGAESYLFPNMVTRRQGSQSVYKINPAGQIKHPESIVKLALLSAGYEVPKGTGVHAIRRTCARLLFDHLVTEENADRALAHVSSLMHHSSRRTTELYLGITGDRALRNKMVRSGGQTPLTLATATTAKTDSEVSATARVYRLRPNTV